MSKTLSAEQHMQEHELCSCCSLFAMRKESHLAGAEQGNFVPIAPALNTAFQTTLESYFPRSTPFSILLLHITQFEQLHTSSPLHQYVRCHASATLLEQVMRTVRRALRISDQILVDEQSTGAVLLFPQVGQEGMARISERVSYNIHLLEAATVIPPLHYKTEIVLGSGSYPEPAFSLDKLFAHASQVQERIVFRPVCLPQPVQTHPRISLPAHPVEYDRLKEAHSYEIGAAPVPFMQIPSRLPARLKQLIPYALALELRCAPVGRDHKRLTVAMANPADTRAASHLSEATGMTIFPVACEITALNTLLASGW